MEPQRGQKADDPLRHSARHVDERRVFRDGEVSQPVGASRHTYEHTLPLETLEIRARQTKAVDVLRPDGSVSVRQSDN